MHSVHFSDAAVYFLGVSREYSAVTFGRSLGGLVLLEYRIRFGAG